MLGLLTSALVAISAKESKKIIKYISSYTFVIVARDWNEKLYGSTSYRSYAT